MELIIFYLLYVLFAYALELMDESQNDNNIYDQKRTNIASGHARYFSKSKQMVRSQQSFLVCLLRS